MSESYEIGNRDEGLIGNERTYKEEKYFFPL